jgi:hypothetical protein
MALCEWLMGGTTPALPGEGQGRFHPCAPSSLRVSTPRRGATVRIGKEMINLVVPSSKTIIGFVGFWPALPIGFFSFGQEILCAWPSPPAVKPSSQRRLLAGGDSPRGATVSFLAKRQGRDTTDPASA